MAEMMKIDKEKMNILTSRGLSVHIRSDAWWNIMKPNEVPGNFIEGYEQTVVRGKNFEERVTLNSPISRVIAGKGKYVFEVWEYVPGPGPGDFAIEFASLDDCLQDVIDYYFGDSARMDEKKANRGKG